MLLWLRCTRTCYVCLILIALLSKTCYFFRVNTIMVNFITSSQMFYWYSILIRYSKSISRGNSICSMSSCYKTSIFLFKLDIPIRFFLYSQALLSLCLIKKVLFRWNIPHLRNWRWSSEIIENLINLISNLTSKERLWYLSL